MADPGSLAGPAIITPSARDGDASHNKRALSTENSNQSNTEEGSGKSLDLPSVTLSASIIGLQAGDELKGTVVRIPPSERPLLRTEYGDFAVDPISALPDHGDVTLVVIRTDRIITGLLTVAKDQPLNPPLPVNLALTSARTIAPHSQIEAPLPILQYKAGVPGVEAYPIISQPSLPGKKEGQGLGTDAHPLTSEPNLTDKATQKSSPLVPEVFLPELNLAPEHSFPIKTTYGPGHISESTPPARENSRSNLNAPKTSSVNVSASSLSFFLEGSGAKKVAAEFLKSFDVLFDHADIIILYKDQRIQRASLIAIEQPGDTTPITAPPLGTPLERLSSQGQIITAVAINKEIAEDLESQGIKNELQSTQKNVPPENSFWATVNDTPVKIHVSKDIPIPPEGVQFVFLLTGKKEEVPPLDQAKNSVEIIKHDYIEAPSLKGSVEVQGLSAPPFSDISFLQTPAVGIGNVPQLSTPFVAIQKQDPLVRFLLAAFVKSGLCKTDELNIEVFNKNPDGARHSIELLIQKLSVKSRDHFNADPDHQPDTLRQYNLVVQTSSAPIPILFSVWVPQEKEHPSDNPENSNKNKEKRFSLVVDFNELGLVSFQGKVALQQLELLVETKRKLPHHIEQNAQMAFVSSLEAGGMTGKLQFQSSQA